MNKTQASLVKEGTTELFVFTEKSSLKGPCRKSQTPFYNSAMELNRDVSVLVNQWFLNSTSEHIHILDGLAASGIRGIRLANELSGDFDVSINDWNDQSFSLIQRNLEKHSLKNVSVSQRDLNCLLSDQRFHCIDIDPFGSPVYFIGASMRSVYNHGLIACTATDTAALCGVFPKVCYRRYGAWPLHGPSMHEIGLRILLGCLCREAAKYDRGIEPIMSYTTDHYFRLYVQVHNGKTAANTSMSQYQSISASNIPLTKKSTARVGPLWIGSLGRKSVIQEIRSIMSTKVLNTKPLLWKLLYLLEEESDAPAFFYTMNDLASLLKVSPPDMKSLFRQLRSKGFLVTKTHCTSTGFKTDAPFDIITEVFK
jgi:tRNA (guanine26-N2/guanine27-N2)-dimethyltransferase